MEIPAIPLDFQSQATEDWRVAQAAHRELQRMAMPPVNLLVIGADGVVRNILKLISPELDQPIATWRPGERFALPSESRAGTVILDDVGALASDEQRRLLEWLERQAGRTRLVSTTTAPLFPLVKSGAFIDALYYRLNLVCVDATSRHGIDDGDAGAD